MYVYLCMYNSCFKYIYLKILFIQFYLCIYCAVNIYFHSMFNIAIVISSQVIPYIIAIFLFLSLCLSNVSFWSIAIVEKFFFFFIWKNEINFEIDVKEKIIKRLFLSAINLKKEISKFFEEKDTQRLILSSKWHLKWRLCVIKYRR